MLAKIRFVPLFLQWTLLLTLLLKQSPLKRVDVMICLLSCQYLFKSPCKEFATLVSCIQSKCRSFFSGVVGRTRREERYLRYYSCWLGKQYVQT